MRFRRHVSIDMSMSATYVSPYVAKSVIWRRIVTNMSSRTTRKPGHVGIIQIRRHVCTDPASMDPGRPFNDLPLLPPQVEVETRAVLKKCVGARTALAELRLAGQLIPDPGVLIHTIPNLEARASSEIENIVTTNDALFRAASLGDDAATPATKEAARYRTALYEGVEALKARPLSTNIAIEICRTIKGVQLDIRRTPGTTLRNSHTGEVIYTPPEGEGHLRNLLSNWERFLHERTALDALVGMAVQHYQFEAIHPFSDG